MEKVLLQCLPARDWREATPLGNGRLGALVHGRASDERVSLNHESLFNWAIRDELPDLSGLLPEVRTLLREGRFAEAERLYPDRLAASGFKGRTGKFFPAFDLRIRCRTNGAFRDYSRELDLSRGVSTVRWTDDGGEWERVSFVDCKSGCTGPFLIRIRRHGSPFSLSVSLPRHDLADYRGYGGWDEFSSEIRGDSIFSSVKTPDGLDFSGIARLISTDGGVSSHNDALDVSDATEAVILADVSSRPIASAGFDEAVGRFTSKGFDELLASHSAAFSERFWAFSVSLVPPDAAQESNERLLLDSHSGAVDLRLVEKMADFGRYLLLASSGFGCNNPANLQGLWNGDYAPAWSGAFFFNENVQMAYWQALPGAIEETLNPLFALLKREMDDFRDNARKFYGCRGILVPVFVGDRSGQKSNFQPHCVYWTGAAAWLAAFHFDFWLHTGSKKFLSECAWPFMHAAAQFYEDFLFEGPDGRLHAAPGVSPENRFGNGAFSVCSDPTMEIALVRELLANCIAAADALGLENGEETAKWREMLAKLPDYAFRENGALKEWIPADFTDNDRHRHLSHLYPVFPGREATPHRNRRLFEAIRLAAEARLASGLPDQTGWSLAHLACVRARLCEGDSALECLNLLLRCCTSPNLFTHHNDWRGMGVTLELLHGDVPPIQLDAAFGFAAAVQQMLFCAGNGEMRFFPALPSSWKSGSAKGFRAPGGFVVDLEWNETTLHAVVQVPATPLQTTPSALEVHFVDSDETRLVKISSGATLHFTSPRHLNAEHA